MARARTAKHPAPVEVEPEEISQEVPEEEPETEDDEPGAGGKAISKAAAVRDALEQGEESPEDGVAYIRKIHGIDMTRQTFSSYKAQQKARDAKKQEAAPKAKPGRKPREVAEPVQVSPPTKQTPAAGDSGLIEALEAMKPLVASLGADKVKRLVDLLG